MNILEEWKEFSSEWKKVCRGFPELSVHDFRVAARRMISALELASSLSHDAGSAALTRQIKKILKRFGPLRDIQVHLRGISRLGYGDILRQFSRFLKKRESEEARRIRSRMRDDRRKKLHRGVCNADRTLQNVLPQISPQTMRSEVRGLVQRRFDALILAQRSYRRSSGPDDFHRMRVQFKRFRYVSERARPILKNITEKQIDRMKQLQGLMGEIHDLHTLRAELLTWSEDHNESAPVKTVITQLGELYEARLKSFNGRSDGFNSLSHRERAARSAG